MSTIYGKLGGASAVDTTDRELLAQALEALEEINKLSIGKNAISLPAEIDTAMDALRERLERPELEFKQPTKIFGPNLEQMLNAAGFYRKKEWVGLTDDEKHDCYLKIDVWSRCVEAVESKLKEKNGG